MQTMKANELRIGNLFYAIERRGGVDLPLVGFDVAYKVLIIEPFRVHGLFHHSNPANYEKWNEFGTADISPIPLTEEWLLKFGFKKNDNIFYHPNHPDYELENHSRYEGIWGMGIDGYLDIRLGKLPETIYVHQLQNLYFALTGEELTIKEK